MVDLSTAFGNFLAMLESNPAYLLLVLGGAAFFCILLVVWHIHRIRREEIFVHQAWGAKWKGR
jgi:hypothetical protein